MEVFISYSHKDKNIADAICTFLEENKIKCWIAPRDIRAGHSFPREIVRAIKRCTSFVLIFSNSTNTSEHVANEVQIAVENDKLIVPFRIENAELNDTFSYYLNRKHWIEAFPNPENSFIILQEQLSAVLKSNIKKEEIIKDNTEALNTKQKLKPKNIQTTPNELVTKEKPDTEFNNSSEKEKVIDIKSKFQDLKSESTISTHNIEEKKLTPKERYGKWGYVDQDYNIVISFEYDNARPFYDGLAEVQQNGKLGFIDKIGKVIIPMIYEKIYNYRLESDGLLYVIKDNKRGIVEKTGKVIIPVIYDQLSYGFSDGLTNAKKDTKWGYIDKLGNEVIPFHYEEAEAVKEGLMKVKQNGKWGFIDTMGITVIPIKYDKAFDFSEDVVALVKDGKCGFVDKNNREIISFKYDGNVGNYPYIKFKKGLANVKLNDKWGYINKTDKVVIPFQYDEAYPFVKQGIANVIKTRTWFWFFKGKEIKFHINKEGKITGKHHHPYYF